MASRSKVHLLGIMVVGRVIARAAVGGLIVLLLAVSPMLEWPGLAIQRFASDSPQLPLDLSCAQSLFAKHFAGLSLGFFEAGAGQDLGHHTAATPARAVYF